MAGKIDPTSCREITGQDLIGLGFEPGPYFKEVLERASAEQLSLEQARQLADRLKPPPVLPLQHPAPYTVFADPENEEEQANIDAVVDSFNELVKTPTIIRGAIMPDACPAGPRGTIPVGGVVAARDAIHPGMHSADVCCSLMVTVVDGVTPAGLLDAVDAVTHFGPGGRDHAYQLSPDLLHRCRDNRFTRDPETLRVAGSHLATQGDGNHFAFVGTLRSTGQTALVTHHGSRGFGARIYKEGMRVAEAYRQQLSPATLKQNAWIPASSEEGQEYWEALMLARRWTKLNHEFIHVLAVKRAGATPYAVHFNEHNFVFRDGDTYYHAKGATPVHTPHMVDNTGLQIIPMNMGQPVLLVRGEWDDASMGFAPHGAGRNLSRGAHRRKLGDKPVEEILAEETAGLDVRFKCGTPDITELPSAYKDAGSVVRDIAKHGLAEIVDYIDPYGSIMAGDIPRGR